MRIDGIKVEVLMGEKRLTKLALSKKSGITRQNISKIVARGTCEPRTAGRLAAGLGVDLKDIIKTEE